MVRSRVLVLVLLLCAPVVLALEVPPPPARWITDRAGLLSTTEVALLDSKLQAFEEAQGSQFLIYIFPSLEGESMEEFTIRCVERWKVGQKKYDNGLVLFVFAREKRVRVEVGYGLEGTITDAFSSRVIREILAPPFQRGAYAEGLNAAADAIIRKIRTGEEPTPAPRPAGGQAAEDGDLSPFTIVIILFIVFFVVLPMLGRRRGGCGGCLPLFFLSGLGGGRGVTFGGGGFSGGGGGWGGGGFSGGGGSFGGGGASGGW